MRRDHPESDSRIHTVGVGIDVEEIRLTDSYQRDRAVVLVVGRLEAYKHVDRTIEAFAKCNADADMVIIGVGPQREGIERLIRELGLERRVQLLGYVDQDEVRRWQRTAKVVVSLSSAESFGMGLAEASVGGARVLASDIPAHHDVSSMAANSFEFVSLSASSSTIAEALQRSLASDPGPIHCTFPTWEDVGRRVLAFYKNAASAR